MKPESRIVAGGMCCMAGSHNQKEAQPPRKIDNSGRGGGSGGFSFFRRKKGAPKGQSEESRFPNQETTFEASLLVSATADSPLDEVTALLENYVDQELH